jgi:hypothetical protein
MKTRSWDPEGLRFKRYLGPVLDALRTLGGSATRQQVVDQIAHDLNLPPEAVGERRRSGNLRFPDQVSWARLYLKHEGLIDSPKHGVWALTNKGRATHLSISDGIAIVSYWDNAFTEGGKTVAPRSQKVESQSMDDCRHNKTSISFDDSLNVLRSKADNSHCCDDHVALLVANGFKRIGSWSVASSKLQRCINLEKRPGVYAFVVNDRIEYIGKATNIRGRLRGYNRSLLPEPTPPFRLVHQMIRQTVEADGTVEAWVFMHGSESHETIERLEEKWITGICPAWNVLGVPR